MYLIDRKISNRLLYLNFMEASRPSLPQVDGNMIRVGTWTGEGALFRAISPIAFLVSVVNDAADGLMTTDRPDGLLTACPTLPSGKALVVWAKDSARVVVRDSVGEHLLSYRTPTFWWEILGIGVSLTEPNF